MTREIQLSQGKVALVDDDDYDMLMTGRKWSALKRRGGRYYYAMRSGPGELAMHRVITGAGPGQCVDHINGDGLDNRRCNLRICTMRENFWNSGPHIGSTTGFKGVSQDRHAGRYKVHIQANGVRHWLGYADTPEDGARIYDEAARELHGKFAHLNFPDPEDTHAS